MKASDKKQMVKKALRPEKAEASRLASAIWELAELPLQETESAGLIAGYLADRGFRVTWPFKALPTAFKAIRGKGRPVVGMLGEYDALPDCGLEPGTAGHGCGHNLLGVAPAAAAVAAARMLEEQGRSGRVVYWGCPAEEALAGKAYMARDGGFRGMDACLCWHPSGDNRVKAAGGAALDSLVFDFRGRTAHGASAHAGRSALDAALLTDVAANYLREHVPENVRMHCVIREGGNAPNVVPESARIWYYVRGKDREQVDGVTRRLTRCARGAAMATETTVRRRKITAIYSRLRNEPMAELVRDNMVLMGVPRATKEDRKRVEELGDGLSFARGAQNEIDWEPGRASSDEDTVSWLAPLGGFALACVAKGTRGHHRQYTAQTNLPFAHRGMMHAAEILAASAWDLFTNAALRRRVRGAFRKGTRGFRFDPLIPENQRPPIEGV
jgi:aminobenzoyl-glutamate utilization protein B